MPSVGPPELLIFVGSLVFLALILYVLLVAVARGLQRAMPATKPERDPALDIARTRFAHGEIDEVEYERLRSVLQRH